MDNELAVKEQFDVILTEDYINELTRFKELEAKMKVLEEKKRNEILEIMKKFNLKKFENEKIYIDYILPSERTVVDTAKMKEEGIYDSYTKKTQIKESIRFSLKYED